MKIFFSLFVILLSTSVYGQDTVRIDYQNFINQVIEKSTYLKAQKEDYNKALAKEDEVKSNSFFPSFSLTTNHAIMPGVTSPAGLQRDEWHLDPNLENDWENWQIFTSVQVSALQPIFTWGAISNTNRASEYASDAVYFKTQKSKEELEYKALELYFSYKLARDLDVLISEAEKTLERAERKIDEVDDDELEQKDIFQFKIYREKFLVKEAEVEANKKYAESIVNLALQTENVVYIPEDDSILNLHELKPIDFYLSSALQNRSEVKALEAARKASLSAIQAQNAEKLPMIFLGLGGEYVHTPRPVQAQPFIGNRFDYINLVYSFGFRQNLNFSKTSSKVEQLKATERGLGYNSQALEDAIYLEVEDAYKNYIIKRSKALRIANALQHSKEWLRMEQVDYDLGFGEIKNLVDAMKANLELEAEYKQALFEYNIKKAKLLNVSSIKE